MPMLPPNKNIHSLLDHTETATVLYQQETSRGGSRGGEREARRQGEGGKGVGERVLTSQVLVSEAFSETGVTGEGLHNVMPDIDLCQVH